jgi:hypothetical protein
MRRRRRWREGTRRWNEEGKRITTKEEGRQKRKWRKAVWVEEESTYAHINKCTHTHTHTHTHTRTHTRAGDRGTAGVLIAKLVPSRFHALRGHECGCGALSEEYRASLQIICGEGPVGLGVGEGRGVRGGPLGEVRKGPCSGLTRAPGTSQRHSCPRKARTRGWHRSAARDFGRWHRDDWG